LGILISFGSALDTAKAPVAPEMLVLSVLMDQLRRHGSPCSAGRREAGVMAEDFQKHNRGR
jgi:hypothetical protein